MSKIGTAHVEIKPVLNEEALATIAQRIEDEITSAVQRGLATATATTPEEEPRHA